MEESILELYIMHRFSLNVKHLPKLQRVAFMPLIPALPTVPLFVGAGDKWRY